MNSLITKFYFTSILSNGATWNFFSMQCYQSLILIAIIPVISKLGDQLFPNGISKRNLQPIMYLFYLCLSCLLKGNPRLHIFS